MKIHTCFFAFLIICATAFSSYGKPVYSRQDSARAKAYFDSSWRYGLFSVKHQQYLDSALQIIPTHAYYWQQKSMPLYKAEKYSLARPFLDSAVKYDQNSWLDYRAYMKCIFEKDYEASLSDFYKAAATLGNRTVMDHPYDFWIALCHLQLNNFDSAGYYLDRIISTTTKERGANWVHYNHLFYRGIVHFDEEDYSAAIQYFDKALAIHNTFSDAQYYKAMCLYRLQRKEEALSMIELSWANSLEGYSLNEDNDKYEYYPYQVRKYYIRSFLDSLRKEYGKK